MAILIYTDGSAKGNPGRGGYGVVMLSGKHRKEISAGFLLTTNNRMELLAVIVGLESVKKQKSEIIVYSDSKYVVNAIEKGWLFNWQKKNFKGKKNSDLWIRFLSVYNKHSIRFFWVKGHNNNIENERCDRLAVSAAEGSNLISDVWYENQNQNNSSSLF